MPRTKVDRALARDVRRHVYPFSAFERARLDRAGLGPTGLRGRVELEQLDPVELSDVVDPRDVVLRPNADTLRRSGLPFRLRVRWAGAKKGREHAQRRVVDEAYKPVHWTVAGGVPLASTQTDLIRLADLGVRWLRYAGVKDDDVVVTVGDRGPRLAFEQLVFACRRARISALHLGATANAALLASLRPTVLAGAPEDLLTQLQGVEANGDVLDELALVIALDDPLDEPARERLASLAPNAAVLSVWAPPGVRAPWAECLGADGLHTSSDCEVIQVGGGDAGGDVVWTPIGWKGSVVLRLRTGARGMLDETPCRHCDQRSPRLRITSVQRSAPDVLQAHPAVADWQIERRRVDGAAELLVFLTPTARRLSAYTLRELDRDLSATQLVVLSPAEMALRLAEHGGRRVVDQRGT